MGTATTIAKPKADVTFVEDIPTEQATALGAIVPSGLVNLGNTCYLNSTLEVLRHIPQLRDALKDAATEQDSSLRAAERVASAVGIGMPGEVPGANELLAAALGQLFRNLDSSRDAVQPLTFLGMVRSAYPIFAERDARGGFKQQDSEEFQNTLLTQLSRALTRLPSNLRGPTGAPITRLLPGGGGTAPPNLIDTLLGMDMLTKYSCAETDAEPEDVRHDGARTLVCNIQGGAGSAIQVNHLHEGIMLVRTTASTIRVDREGTRGLSSYPTFLLFLRRVWTGKLRSTAACWAATRCGTSSSA